MRRGTMLGAVALAATAGVAVAVVTALRPRRPPVPEVAAMEARRGEATRVSLPREGAIRRTLAADANRGSGTPAASHGGHAADSISRPPSQLVRVVVGGDPANDVRYQPRADALRALAVSRELSRADAVALLEYVASTNGALRPSREAALKNDVLNLLRRQRGTIPGETADLLSSMLRDGSHPTVVRDYCVQHLGALLGGISDPVRREVVRDALCLAAESRESYAGTALYALAEDSCAPEEQMRFLRRRAAGLVRGENANPLARISAVMLAGEMGWTEVLPALRTILESPGADVPLAIAALGALGSLGGPQDIPLVESVSKSGGVRLAPAAKRALMRLNGSRGRGGVPF